MENQITASIKEITPEMAKEILENNHADQRKIKESRVRKYAEEIAIGAWIINGETIVISENGRLLDGQHRVLAVIRANEPIRTLLVENVPEQQNGYDTFATINTENRSNADALYIAGFKDETPLFVKYISLFKAFQARKLKQHASGIRLNNHEIVDEARLIDYEEALIDIERAKRLHSRCDLLSVNYWILAVRVFKNLPDGNKFLEALADCDVNESKHPIMAYKRKLENLQNLGGSSKFNKMRWIGMFRAYDKMIKDEEIGNMIIKPTQDIDYPEWDGYEEA